MRGRETPAVAVAEGEIELAPGPHAEWAIDTSQTRDKEMLLVGMFLILAVVFAGLGRLARSQWWLSVAGWVALAAIGAVAVLVKPATQWIELVPVVVGLITWLVGMAVLAELLRRWEVVEDSDD